MGWIKDYGNYCRYCEERGKEKHLYIWDTDYIGVGFRGYFCKKCGDKDDPETYQQNCASCDLIYEQHEFPLVMCDNCTTMICQECVDDDNYSKCFRCDDRLCTKCRIIGVYRGKEYVSCKKHKNLEKTTCSKFMRVVRYNNVYCQRITGPERKYCKQHRYHHQRRKYVKK